MNIFRSRVRRCEGRVPGGDNVHRLVSPPPWPSHINNNTLTEYECFKHWQLFHAWLRDHSALWWRAYRRFGSQSRISIQPRRARIAQSSSMRSAIGFTTSRRTRFWRPQKGTISLPPFAIGRRRRKSARRDGRASHDGASPSSSPLRTQGRHRTGNPPVRDQFPMRLDASEPHEASRRHKYRD